MERYLESLLEREQFTFIRTGVVTLTLARRSAYQIRMDVVAVTGDIAGFLDILAPVASLLPGFDDIDSYHLHFPSVRIDVVTGNPYLPGVLDTGNEALDILLFLFDAFQLLQRVRDMLFSTDVTPVILMYLDLVLYTGMIPELCLLAFSYQPFDVIPVPPENAGVIRYGIVLESRSRETYQNSEFPLTGSYSGLAITSGFPSHQHHKFPHRVARVEQADHFIITCSQCRIAPVVRIDYMVDFTVLGFLETAVASLLMYKPVNLFPVLGQDDYRHTEEEILHVGSLLELKGRKTIPQHPSSDFRMPGRLLSIHVHVLQTGTVTGDDIKQLVLTHHLIHSNHLDNLKRQLVVCPEIDIRHAVPSRNRCRLNIRVFIKYQTTVRYGSHFCGHVRDLDIKNLPWYECGIVL